MYRTPTDQPHYVNRADEPIDPHNPFQNPTEMHEYTPDYSEIVPQISMKGCRIPLIPSNAERGKICKYYTLAGLLAALDYYLAMVLITLMYYIVGTVQKTVDSGLLDGAFPHNYSDIQRQFFGDTSIEIGINLLAFLIANTVVFLIGSKLSHTRISSYFQDKQLSASTILRYIFVGLFIQIVMGVISDNIQTILDALGHEMYIPDFSTGTSPTKILLNVLYSCLVAPLTEELVFRGVVLKNLSRVSQRLGIFLSALFFALAHENIPQGILSFVLGIFLAYITSENNSLVPAMIVHFCINTSNTVFSVLPECEWFPLTSVYGVYFLLILAFGTVALIYTVLNERLPSTTPHQSFRGITLALSSVGIWLFLLTHLGSIFINSLLQAFI